MRVLWISGAFVLVVAATGCTTSPAPLPLAVGGGVGSEHGNYAARMAGEMVGPSGERCVVFDWDRPLTAELAIRLKSASCESSERPGWMECRELSRSVIPIEESSLVGEEP